MLDICLSLSFALSCPAQDDLEAALRRFSRGYASPDPKARATAVDELSKTPDVKSLQRIVPLLTGDAKEVRIAAAKGMSNFKDYKKIVIPALTGALAANAKEIDVQLAILEGLGKLQDEAALPTIHQNFRGPQVKVAKAALGAAAAIRAKDSLVALHEFLLDLQKWEKTKKAGGYKDGDGGGDGEASQKARLQDVTQETIKTFQTITRENWVSLREWDVWCRKRLPTFTVPK